MPKTPYTQGHDIAVGDRITFTSTVRDGRRKATRIVVGFDSFGRPEVRYFGWGNFIVGAFDDIIHSVQKADDHD